MLLKVTTQVLGATFFFPFVFFFSYYIYVHTEILITFIFILEKYLASVGACWWPCTGCLLSYRDLFRLPFYLYNHPIVLIFSHKNFCYMLDHLLTNDIWYRGPMLLINVGKFSRGRFFCT